MDAVTGLLSMESQIAALREEIANYQKPRTSPKTETVEEVVRRILSEQQAKPPSVPAPEVKASPVSYGESLLHAIGSALSEPQQIWLSTENVQAKIPEFLLTFEGQAITRRFIDMYQTYLRSK